MNPGFPRTAKDMPTSVLPRIEGPCTIRDLNGSLVEQGHHEAGPKGCGPMRREQTKWNAKKKEAKWLLGRAQ